MGPRDSRVCLRSHAIHRLVQLPYAHDEQLHTTESAGASCTEVRGRRARRWLPPRVMGLHRDVLDQLPCCFIELEASGDGLRPAIQQSQSFVEGPANHAFHCKVRNAVVVAVLT